MLNSLGRVALIRFVRRTFALIVIASSTFSAAATPSVPVLRVTAPNGQRSILIGTMHVSVGGLREPAPSIFAGARHYVIEHSGSSTLPVDQTSGSESGRDWAKSLTDGEVDTYLRRAACAGLTEKKARDLLREPTPHEANAFAYTICPLPRHTTSRDAYIYSIAPASLAQHPEILEDANWVELQRRMVPASSNLTGFRCALEHDPKTVLEQTRDALNAGDYDALRTQVLESFGSTDAAAAYGGHMVDERNAEWLPRLEALFNDGDAVVAVGAMHFPGPAGLIALLRQQGYTVDAIAWPAASVGDGA